MDPEGYGPRFSARSEGHINLSRSRAGETQRGGVTLRLQFSKEGQRPPQGKPVGV